MALSANTDMKVSARELRGDDGDGDTAVEGGSGGVLKVLGVLVGATVILGGVWIGFGDQIMGFVGDPDGEVPVVTADPSPVKVRPENPGGMQVPNQGRLVYGVVDGTSNQPRVERLLPSPEKPVAVDEVLKRKVPETSNVVSETAPRGTADNANAPRRLEPAAPVGEVPTAEDVSKLEEPAPAPTPTASTEQQATSSPPAPAPKAPGAGATAGQAPSEAAPKAPKPISEPETVTKLEAQRPTPAPETPATDLSSTFRVQLAAARSEKAVESEWDRLRRRHVDLLGDMKLQVTRIDLGESKGIFYRLRVGPLANEAAAKALCERLKQRKLGCLVVKPGA